MKIIMKENKSDYELISESLEEYIDEADEMVLCVYRNKLDTSKITHRHEVVDVHEEKDKILLPYHNILTSKDDKYVNVSRLIVENNEDFIQLVVGLIVKCKDKYVLMKCEDGIMNGNTTLIQGHVNWDKGTAFTLYNILQMEMIRELYEEISIDNIIDNVHETDLELMYVTYNTWDKTRPSYYHYGFIYKLELPETIYNGVNTINLVSKEPEKNKVIVITKEELKNIVHPDTWLGEMVNRDNF